MAIDFKKFNDPKFAQRVRQAASDAMRTANRAAGMDLWSALRALDRQRERVDASVRPFYDEAMRDAFFASLPALPNRIIVDALPEYIPAIIDNEQYNLLDQFKKKLATVEIMEERDELRRLTRDAFAGSEARVTEAPAAAGSEKRAGALKEWIALYNEAVGAGKTDSVKRSEFLSGKAVSALSEIERKRIEKITKFFDYLKLSSIDPEGVPEDLEADFTDEVYIMREGKVERVEPFEDEFVQKTAELFDAYRRDLATRAGESGPLERQAEEEAKKQGMTKEKAKGIIQEIFQSGSPPAPAIVLAALQTLFRAGKIGDFFETMQSSLANYLQSARAGDVETLNRRMAIFKAGANLPGTLELFLKIVLMERLGLASAHAAAVSARLIARLPKAERAGYLEIAYYDMESGEFQWGGGISEKLQV